MIDDEDDTGEPAEAMEDGRKLRPSKPWLSLIDRFEKAGYESYQEKCTNIEKRYADLERMSAVARARSFSIFWANIEVLKPSMYSRPPVPVVTPRFRDRKPLPRAASELLERATVVAFEREDIDGVMRAVRDDLALLNRGVPWVRYEAKSRDNDYVEKTCIDHVNRRDFAHEPGREWKEVGWAARRAWMTRKEMRKRFRKTSGDAYQDAAFEQRKDDRNNTDGKLKASVWEIWSKTENKVVWVSEGVEVVLDEDKPHLALEGFFPCPKPAYGTLQRDSLIPVPDYVFYKDQDEEISELTARISALSESLRLRGFYPAGAGEIGDAIEAAIKSTNDRQVLVPISNWAAFGNGGAKDTIVWLPLDMVASTITQLVTLRRQLIEDVYQITGLSDVMRGSTDPNETLGAQTLKTQYGSVRIRDRQSELVRVARDLARIVAEVMAENFRAETLLDMAQMEFPTDAEIRKQAKQLEDAARKLAKELEQAQTNPEIQALVQKNPEEAQQILQQAQGQIAEYEAQAEKLRDSVTIDKIMDLLRDQHIRPFVLDIETDSTIQPDEDAEKQRRTEFLTALGTVLPQLGAMVQQQPDSAPLAAEILKFTTSPFRAGRSLEGVIEEFAEKMKANVGQARPDPNAAKAEADAKANSERMAVEQAKAQAIAAKAQSDAETARAKSETDIARINAEAAKKQQESDLRIQEIIARSQAEAQKHAQDMQKGELELAKLRLQVMGQAQKNQAAAIAASQPPQVSA